MRDVRHTRFGWWLEEAGPIDPRPPLEGDTRADVVVVGGGYLGLWTAWQLKALEPECDVVVLEAGLAGHGPSGRNGGFVSSLWDDLPILRDRLGDTAAVAVARASERPLDGIEEWCAREGVDAWFRRAPTLYVATSEAQVGSSDDAIAACAAVGAPEELRRSRPPSSRLAALPASTAGRSCGAPRPSSRHGSRSGSATPSSAPAFGSTSAAPSAV